MIKATQKLLIPVVLVTSNALADSYQVYFPSTMPGMIMDGQGNYYTDKEIVLVNNDTRVVKKIDADAYILKFDNDNTYDFGSQGIVNINGTSPVRTILDFKGSAITVRESQMVIVQDNNGTPNDTTDDGSQLYYDRILTIDVATGEIIGEKLVANSTDAKNYAEAAGLSVDTVNLGDVQNTTQAAFTSYAENITNDENSGAVVITQGSFSTAKITDADGTSLFRQEDDGTVHIGENSIVLADENVSNSGYDQIYSSSGTLELGNSATHTTVITGNLSVNGPLSMNGNRITGLADPSSDSDAVNRSYADGIAAEITALASIPRSTESGLIIGLGVGAKNSQSAIAFGGSGRVPNTNVHFTLGGAYSSSTKSPTFGAGIGWGF